MSLSNIEIPTILRPSICCKYNKQWLLSKLEVMHAEEKWDEENQCFHPDFRSDEDGWHYINNIEPIYVIDKELLSDIDKCIKRIEDF